MPSLDTAVIEELAPTPVDDGWYIAIDDETVGPFSTAEVEERARDGGLDAEQLIWTAGMSDWLPVADLPKLALLLPAEVAVEEAPELEAPVSWTPQTAAALSALVEQVEVEPEAAVEEGAASDPFGSLPPMTFIAAETPAWRMPAPEPQAARVSRRPLIVFGGLTAAGCIAGVVFGLLLAGADTAVPDIAPEPSPRVVAPPPPPPPPLKPPILETSADDSPGDVAPVLDELKERTRRRRRNIRTPPPPPPRIEVTKEQVARAALAQRPSLKPCVANAVAARELAPGNHQLVVSWVIGPKGNVLKPRLVGPTQVLGTSLPTCVARIMREWTFPASGERMPVHGFPLVTARIH